MTGPTQNSRVDTAYSSPAESVKATLRDLVRICMRYPLRGRTRLKQLAARFLAPRAGWEDIRVGPYRLAVDHRQEAMLNMAYGCYETREMQFLRRVVRPGDLVFDVGANAGYVTAHLARFTAPNGRVYVFEPAPQCWPLLERLAGQDPTGRIRIVRCAVSDRIGVGTYYSTGSLFSRGYGRLDERPSSVHEQIRPHEVRITTLDAFIDAAALDPRALRLVKVDVEGHELAVLRGMSRSIERGARPVLLLEMTRAPGHMHLFEGIRNLLAGWGYSPHVLHGRARRADLAHLPTGFHGNIAWIPAGPLAGAESGHRDHDRTSCTARWDTS